MTRQKSEKHYGKLMMILESVKALGKENITNMLCHSQLNWTL